MPGHLWWAGLRHEGCSAVCSYRQHWPDPIRSVAGGGRQSHRALEGHADGTASSELRGRAGGRADPGMLCLALGLWLQCHGPGVGWVHGHWPTDPPPFHRGSLAGGEGSPLAGVCRPVGLSCAGFGVPGASCHMPGLGNSGQCQTTAPMQLAVITACIRQGQGPSRYSGCWL